jgi:hypothetical protein
MRFGQRYGPAVDEAIVHIEGASAFGAERRLMRLRYVDGGFLATSGRTPLL